MSEIFSRYRKAIITASGVIVFLIAGLITMIFTDSGNDSEVNHQITSQSSQPQNEKSSEIPQTQKQNDSSRTVYVYITGEITKPGVYKLSEDARIFQLVEMAGGFTPKADTVLLNLAENVTDGSHIHIGAKSSQQSPLIPGMPANVHANIQPQNANTPVTYSHSQPQSQSSSGRVNVNTANATELESLPGVGPAIAKRIIDYRNQHGNFSRPEDLINVRGIGKSKLAQILPHVTAMNTGGSYSAGTRVIQPQSQSSSGLIDINRASQKELERLPGVGPATAKRIIDYRNQHGRFTKAEDLMNIRGIGAAKLNSMRSQIVVR